MKSRLTPHYTDLVCDACLKSFWRKIALTKFLRQCNISEAFLATWAAEETKRDFLDRLFLKLPKTDPGRNGILVMAQHLMDQTSFPDLQNWENSAEKIKEAHDAVSRLRMCHGQQQEDIQSEQDKRRAKRDFVRRQQNLTNSQQSLQKLNDRLNELSRRLGDQAAGYDFEVWFFNMVDFCEVPNRKPYVHASRQIDGSLTLNGTTYLVELKFTTAQADATDIDTFYRKVTSKADNTMGIMVSISGYSEVAKKEASGARTPLLLLEYSHLYLVLGGLMNLGDVIDRVRRHASQTGEAYLSANDFTG